MPRRRVADRIGPVKTRTRSGCQQCRTRKVKCDEKEPVCTRCWERGLPCLRALTLKWESEFLSRGLTFGRAGVWKKDLSTDPGLRSTSQPPYSCDWLPVPRVHGWSFINAELATFEQPHLVHIPSDSLIVCRGDPDEDATENDPSIVTPQRPMLDEASTILACRERPRQALPVFPLVSGTAHSHLFDYYLNEVCPRTTPSLNESSPFAALVLPFSATASPTLVKAIQALSACHWSRFDPSLGAVSLRFKSAVLKELRHKLATEGPLRCSMDTEVLVVMMMLCLYEIVDNCDQRWTVHLRGAKDIVRFRRQRELTLSSPATRSELSSFAELFFAFQDVIGRTACGETALFGADYWRGDEQQINVWMGCSPELVSILSSITELSRSRRQLVSGSNITSFFRQAATLETRLDHLLQVAADTTDITLAAAADLKRQAAILYLHCALYGALPSTPLVVQLVRKILHHVSELIDRGVVASMTWPVFVAAVVLDPLNDEMWIPSATGTAISGRALVLRALAVMAKSAVSNVTRTRAVILKVWQTRDMNISATNSGDSVYDPSVCNDWECYVAPVSTAMSLA